jgi:hypothetical protein
MQAQAYIQYCRWQAKTTHLLPQQFGFGPYLQHWQNHLSHQNICSRTLTRLRPVEVASSQPHKLLLLSPHTDARLHGQFHWWPLKSGLFLRSERFWMNERSDADGRRVGECRRGWVWMLVRRSILVYIGRVRRP